MHPSSQRDNQIVFLYSSQPRAVFFCTACSVKQGPPKNQRFFRERKNNGVFTKGFQKNLFKYGVYSDDVHRSSQRDNQIVFLYSSQQRAVFFLHDVLPSSQRDNRIILYSSSFERDCLFFQFTIHFSKGITQPVK